MKKLMLVLCVVGAVNATEPEKAGEKSALVFGSSRLAELPVISVSPAPNLVIHSPRGSITISMKTGDVTLPEGMTEEVAAVRFWKAVAEVFPHVREAMLQPRKNASVMWMNSKADAGKVVEFGFREDGVVVWREVKTLPANAGN